MLRTLLTCLIVGTASLSPAATAENLDFLKAVQDRYQDSKDFKKYAIHYSYAFNIAYQAYDYQNPHAGHTVMTAEVDMKNKLFADHATTYWPGGFVFDFKEFNNNTEAMQYDVNGVINGRRVRKLGDDVYEKTVAYHNTKVDFLVILPLLAANLDLQNISVTDGEMTGHKVITHTSPEETAVYTFKTMPIDLVSVQRSSDNSKIDYSSYVSRGDLRYASLLRQSNLKTGRKGVFEIAQVREITQISADKLRLPMGYGPLIEKTDRTLFSTEIAKDLYLVTDASAGRNIVFKVTPEGIRVFGAPLNDKRSEETIAVIKNQFPNKEILSVYITHPHSDHIGGLTAYAKLGVPILTDAYSIDAIKAYPRFEKDIGIFKFQPVNHKDIVDGVEFHVLENGHAKGQSFVYFPEAQIIYEGDFLEIPYDNSTADHMPDVSKGFIEYVYSQDMAIKRIVGHHRNNNISAETMNALYEANTD